MSNIKVKGIKDFEKDLKRLEEVVSLLEREEIPLEESVKLFQEGIKLSKDCRATLLSAEQLITEVVSIDDDEVVTKKFDTDNE